MKIEDIKTRSLSGYGEEGPVKGKRAGGDDFARYLREATEAQQAGEVSGNKGLSSLSEAVSAMYVQGSVADFSFADKAASVLEKLSSLLGQDDPKSIGNVIQEFFQLLKGVDPESLSQEGKKLLEEMRIVAYTEGIKWARGDYI